MSEPATLLRRSGWILLSLAHLGLLTSCSAEQARIEPDGGAAMDASESLSGDGSTIAPPLPVLSCSADLQHVVDQNGATVTSCEPDQGCFQGACIAACDAAAASHGNVGCEFIAATPSAYLGTTPPCFAVFVANNWSKAIRIDVSRGGTSYDATKFGRIASSTDPDARNWATLPSTGLPPGEVAVLFLSSDPASSNYGNSLACPVPQAVTGGTAVRGTQKGAAFSIHTDAPASAYDILPYGGARSFFPAAEVLLPTTAWGTNYVAAVPPKQPDSLTQRWGQIVAAADGTTVQINPTVDLPGGSSVPAAPAGQVTTLTLDAGQYIQWQESGEMSGSVISADKPITFVGGCSYLCLKSKTSYGGGCESAHQMVPPVSALGSEYAVAPFVTRRKDLMAESILYRVVGAVDGSTLSFDPPVPGAPTTLGRGAVVDFEATQAFVVHSQDAAHPFYIAQLMPGAAVQSGYRPGATITWSPDEDPNDLPLGDEEFVNVLPPAQFLSRYVFFADPTYSTTNLVLTRVAHNGVFEDVTVDCAGTIAGWQPLGDSGQYQYAHLDLVRSAMGVGACTNGPHTAWSNGAFGVTVWGTDNAASYAYPAGGNVGTITTAVIVP